MSAEKLNILKKALEYVEENLTEDFSQEKCAKACYCSLSSLQKLFRNVFHMGVGDYVTRRRLSNAAEELLNTKVSTLEIAVKYGYGSAESFSRAFSRVWGVSPTEYRKNWRFSQLCPPLNTQDENIDFIYKGEFIMSKKYDISKLYDYIKSNQGTYILTFDTVRLLWINENLGREAGDKAILECLRRIDAECGDDKVMFRIGGDEFVMMTGLSDREQAEKIARKILCHNGENVKYSGGEVEVSMRCGITLLENKKLSYDTLFAELATAPRNFEIKNGL